MDCVLTVSALWTRGNCLWTASDGAGRGFVGVSRLPGWVFATHWTKRSHRCLASALTA